MRPADPVDRAFAQPDFGSCVEPHGACPVLCGGGQGVCSGAQAEVLAGEVVAVKQAACFMGGRDPVKTRKDDTRLFSILPRLLSLALMVRQNGPILVNSQMRTLAAPCRRTEVTLLLKPAGMAL